MDLRDILSIAIASVIVLVVAHIAVFWVVRTLYPPQVPVQDHAPVAASPPITMQPPAQVFTQPVVEEQAVHVPTYQAPVQLEAAREEGSDNFSLNPSAPTKRDAGVGGSNP
jgi:hypothetical protein